MRINSPQRFVIIYILLLTLAGCSTYSTPTAAPSPTTTHVDEIAFTETPAQLERTSEGAIIRETITAPSLASNLLGDPAENEIIVYLPPSYELADERYPVVYFLTGFSTTPDDFLRGLFQGFRLKNVLDHLIQEGTINELIVVIPTGQHSRGGSFFVNSSVTGNWEDFIVNDLVQNIDSRYRSIDNRKSRGIVGYSMGGFGALHIGMRHPETFALIYALSPGLFAPDGMAKSQMFSSTRTINQYYRYEGELRSIPDAADGVLKFLEDELTGNLLFTVNYGMAFTGSADEAVPFFRYPYYKQGDELVLDQDIWSVWDAGFGDLEEKVRKYSAELKSFESIAIDYGTEDEHQWIPEGCEYFAHALEQAGIPLDIFPYEGGHSSQIGMRLQHQMFPYISEKLGLNEKG